MCNKQLEHRRSPLLFLWPLLTLQAVKCIRSIRRWAYTTFGNMRAIQFVVMVTPEDMKGNMEFVQIAEQHVDVPGGSNNNNYANVDLIIDIAVRMGVQAVWAGWGHASELPELPDGLHARGIAFMGPPGHAMRSLGDKISSTIVAQSADVPTMPWSGSGLQIDCAANTAGGELNVPHELYMKGCVTTAKEGLDSAVKIGFPVMIKASEGGGGKGIRKVTCAESFPSMFRQVLAEVPGSPVFIMKLASGARHLEVQLIADAHGTCIALHGRDCSVQRRHQKIIEEAPATIASAEECDAMEKAAVRLGRLVGYVSTGTVEWLYGADGSFQFLELNPRLQVEHPCTEGVSGVNLPAAQLMIAMGLPLHRIPDIREFYGQDKWGSSPIAFDKTTLGTPTGDEIAKPKPKGAIIAVRVTAENPEEGFKPSSGTINALNFKDAPNVWGYFSVDTKGSLHEYADSQFGHIFAWGETREEARKLMICSLSELVIRADFRTTIEYIITMLELDDFKNNNITTEWLDGLIANKMIAYRPEPMTAVITGCAHIADQEITSRLLDFEKCLGRGQILPLGTLKQSITLDVIYEGEKYCIEATRSGPTSYILMLNGSVAEVRLNQMADGGSLVRLNGKTTIVHMKEEIDKYRMTIAGQTVLFEKENDPTMMRAVSAGKLLHYTIEDGAAVKEGEAFAEVEVMKMVMSVFAKASGKVHHEQVAGHIMIPGDLIASLTLDDPTAVKKATLFTTGFPSPTTPESIPAGDAHQQLVSVVADLTNIMSGYALPKTYSASRVSALCRALFSIGEDRTLPLVECREMLSALRGRIDEKVLSAIENQLSNYEGSVSSILCKFPAQKLASIIDSHAATLEGADQDAFLASSAPIQALAKRYRGGRKAFFLSQVDALIQQYLAVEKSFAVGNNEDSITALCKDNAEELKLVVDVTVAHTQVKARNEVLLTLLDLLFDPTKGYIKSGASGITGAGDRAIIDAVEKLAKLSTAGTAEVALKSRAILVKMEVPAFEKRLKSLVSIFSDAQESDVTDQIADLVGQATSVFDVLNTLFYSDSFSMQQSALEVYVRRAYVAYNMLNINVEPEDGIAIATWRFQLPVRQMDDLEGQTRSLALGARHLSPPTSATLTSQQRVVSIGDLASYAKSFEAGGAQASPIRLGVMAVFSSKEQLEAKFPLLLNRFRDKGDPSVEEPINVLNVSLKLSATGDDDIMLCLADFVNTHRDDLYALQIRRVTFLIHQERNFPRIYTYRERMGFKEDAIYRHLDPALAFKLEIGRLGEYALDRVPTRDPKLHMYYGTHTNGKITERRFFVRTVMRDHPDATQDASSFGQAAADSIIIGALNDLELVISDPRYGKTDCNHLFINSVPTFACDPSKFIKDLKAIIYKHAIRLWKLRALEAEIRLTFQPQPTEPEFSVRVIVSNVSGHYMESHVYREVPSPVDGAPMYQGLDKDDLGPLNGQSCVQRYQPKEKTQMKRFAAQSNGTTYVHDYVELLREILKTRWASVAAKIPGVTAPQDIVSCRELVLGEGDVLKELKEGEMLPDSERIGMLAWRVTMRAPECPAGRDIILIANDLTHVIGSFGPREDTLFHRASVLSRHLKIPRIYVSVNSGARIGLAQEVLDKFQVAWTDESKPAKGFDYLYLSEEDYKILGSAGSVKCEAVQAGGETRYKITDVIGQQHGIGVECLKGSGLIAGETSCAYEETFTCTLVSCRSVGIGAYLVRLGQRTIQNQSSHVILTGANALNKLLGKDVYTSNQQLGGPQIMYNNGVSHLCVKDDFDGMRAVLHWISYLPQTPGTLPITRLPYTIDMKDVVYPEDPVDRDVTYTPPNGPYDPRFLLTGSSAVNSGMFDQGSFVELLGGWAQTVVTGRARLGGCPVGVIAVETRPVTLTIPADPANLTSEAVVVQQAGQVWYPDSAFKTAQAISDIDKEHLPLFILANWRGFSGGQHDMYEEVLKFGAMIVDNLQKFRQPVFVYLPPRGELRGGAWVVVDPSINSSKMEMYADENSRGGVLEAEGLCSVKFRKKTQVVVMARIDAEYKALSEQLATATGADKKAIAAKMNARYDALAPMYHQVGVQFADLHDTPGRMKAKDCITSVIPWKNSRRFFHARLRRRTYVDYLLKEIALASPAATPALKTVMLKRWYGEHIGSQQASMWEDDNKVTDWIVSNLSADGTLADDSSIKSHLQAVHQEATVEQVKAMVSEDSDTAFQCVSALLGALTPAQRERLQASLGSSSA